MRWAGPVSRRSRQAIITQKKMRIKISQRLWACSSICSGGSFSCFVCNYLRLKNDTDFARSNTINPRRPFKWLEFYITSQTVGFTPRFEKNDRVITSLFTTRTKFVDWSSTTGNFRWMNFYQPSHFMSSDNTLPEFSLKIMLLTSIRPYFNPGDGIILGYVMIAGWNSFVPCSTLQIRWLQILWSACGQQTCGHVITIFWNRRVKSTVREATQNSSHLKGRRGSAVWASSRSVTLLNPIGLISVNFAVQIDFNRFYVREDSHHFKNHVRFAGWTN